RNEDMRLKINNRIYELLIYDYMSSLIETSTNIGSYNERSAYINEDGNLDIRKILVKFSEFMKHEYSEKREAFLEADGRLLFLAFISPIINGTGFAFKEVQGGDEKRFDIVITYNKKMYILELKRWSGESYHQKGLIQLGEYLDQYGLDRGYLLIFDFRKLSGEVGNQNDRVITVGEKEKSILEVYC
ncbi:MAG: AAA family ATPase, partial [Clostridium sp.]